jgi:hypothetical protein
MAQKWEFESEKRFDLTCRFETLSNSPSRICLVHKTFHPFSLSVPLSHSHSHSLSLSHSLSFLKKLCPIYSLTFKEEKLLKANSRVVSSSFNAQLFLTVGTGESKTFFPPPFFARASVRWGKNDDDNYLSSPTTIINRDAYYYLILYMSNTSTLVPDVFVLTYLGT